MRVKKKNWVLPKAIWLLGSSKGHITSVHACTEVINHFSKRKKKSYQNMIFFKNIKANFQNLEKTSFDIFPPLSCSQISEYILRKLVPKSIRYLQGHTCSGT